MSAYSSEPEKYDSEPNHYTCRRCQGRLKSLEFDGEHEECGARDIDTARQREAIRRLHLSTAKMLQRTGHAEEAAYHFSEAERES